MRLIFVPPAPNPFPTHPHIPVQHNNPTALIDLSLRLYRPDLKFITGIQINPACKKKNLLVRCSRMRPRVAGRQLFFESPLPFPAALSIAKSRTLAPLALAGRGFVLRACGLQERHLPPRHEPQKVRARLLRLALSSLPAFLMLVHLLGSHAIQPTAWLAAAAPTWAAPSPPSTPAGPLATSCTPTSTARGWRMCRTT